MPRVCRYLELVLFADDTNVFAEGKDPDQLVNTVNEGLAELSKWFCCNRLTLNLKKTEYIFFGGPRSKVRLPRNVRIGNDDIKRVEGTKFLGVWVDEGLKWTGYIEKVKAKVSQLLGVIGKTKGALGKEAVRSLYNALVLPHLQYCLMVWGDFEGGRNVTIGSMLLKLQKRFAGMAAGKHGMYHADPLFAQNKILKIEDLYKQQLRVYAWQFFNNRLPENQASMLQRVSEVHHYSTRSAESGLAPTSRDRSSMSYRVSREWSTLPDKLKELTSLTAFKRQSRQLLIKEYGNFECKSTACRVCGSGGEG